MLHFNFDAESGVVSFPEGVSEINFTWNLTKDGKDIVDRRYIKKVIIPSSVKAILVGSFADYTSLTEAPLPEGLRNLDDQAFYGCTSLKKTCLPRSLRRIGYQAFAACESLDEVVFKNCPFIEIGGEVFDDTPIDKMLDDISRDIYHMGG